MLGNKSNRNTNFTFAVRWTCCMSLCACSRGFTFHPASYPMCSHSCISWSKAGRKFVHSPLSTICRGACNPPPPLPYVSIYWGLMHVYKCTTVFTINLCTLNAIGGSFAFSFIEISRLSVRLDYSRNIHMIWCCLIELCWRTYTCVYGNKVFLYVDATGHNDDYEYSGKYILLGVK
jgi:hypothetical protein